MGTPVACLTKENGKPQKEFKMGIGAEWQAGNWYQMARMKSDFLRRERKRETFVSVQRETLRALTRGVVGKTARRKSFAETAGREGFYDTFVVVGGYL